MSFTPDLPSTEDVLAAILAFPTPTLPSPAQHIGSVVASWQEVSPGRVFIETTGGTSDDRHYAETMLAIQLQGHGYERLQFDMDEGEWDVEHLGSRRIASTEHTSAWPDIMAKAKRLVQSGQVQLLRNGYQYVVGHIVGDHGEYNAEFSRDDPNSRAITQWQCECPWDQYAFQRTRKWKKYEGRPCAHLLALYWKSLMTPLDEDLSEEQAKGMGTGQALPGTGPQPAPGQKTEGPAPDSHEHTLPRSFLPDGSINPGDQQQMSPPPDAMGGPPGPAQAPMSPPPGGPGGAPPGGPQPPGVLPPFPADQQVQEWAGPGTTPSGQESPPGAMSVPGAKPPSPFNPLQQPGTYSRTASGENPWQPGAHGKGWFTPEGALHTWQTDGDDGFPSHMDMMGYDQGIIPRDRSHLWGQEPKAAMAEGYWPLLIYPDGTAYNSWSADNSFPEEVRVGIHGANPRITFPRRFRGKVADFQPPQTVRLKHPAMGLAEGPVPGQYGDGSYREVPAGTPGEVLSQDATTGWVEAIFPLDDSGPHEPFHVRLFLDASDLDSASGTPFIRRRSHESAKLADVPVLGASVYHDPAEVAFLREKYGQLIDAPGGHQLYFRPSQRPGAEPGRGLIHDPSGTVYTWPESEGTHASMMWAKGLNSDECSRFYVQPNGVVSQIMGPSESFMTIMGADPSLARANGLPPA